MSDLRIPTTGDVRLAATFGPTLSGGIFDFDHWLERRDLQMKANALREAAEALDANPEDALNDIEGNRESVVRWLDFRANGIERGTSDD